MTPRVSEREQMLLDACRRALALMDSSAYQAEAFAAHSNSIHAELEKGHIKSSYSGAESGIGVRVFKNGSMGYAHASLENVEFAVEKATSAARAGSPDDDFKSLPLPEQYPKVNGTWDQKIAALDVATTVQLAIDVAEASRIDKRVDVINSGASIGTWSGAIANTLGIAGTDSGTQAAIDVDVVAHEGDASGNGFEYAASRGLDFNVELIGRSAGQMALSSIKPLSI